MEIAMHRNTLAALCAIATIACGGGSPKPEPAPLETELVGSWVLSNFTYQSHPGDGPHPDAILIRMEIEADHTAEYQVRIKTGDCTAIYDEVIIRLQPRPAAHTFDLVPQSG